VPSVDPPGQEDLIVAEALGVHHQEGGDQEEGGQNQMLTMVQ
jgi:hypothetical protein